MRKQLLYVLSALAMLATGANAQEATINVDREIGQGYGVTVAKADFTGAKAYLGVDELTTSMIRIINPDESQISDYAPFDGWFATNGTAKTWSALNAEAAAEDKAGICVKFFQAVENGENFEICDMNGADVVGNTYTVKWGLTANDKLFTYTINVTFVAQATVEMEVVDKGIVTSVTYATTEASYVEKVASLTTSQMSTICSELGISALSEATVYGYNPTTQELVKSYAAYDGWRNASGDFQQWSGNSTVPACVKYTDGKDYLCYNIQGCEPQVIKCYWAIANDVKAVLVEIDFIYTDVTAVKGIKANTNNHEAYDLLGRSMFNVQRSTSKKGIYVINGRKVVRL